MSSQPLNVQRVRFYALQRREELASREDGVLFADPSAIGALAGQMAARFYQGQFCQDRAAKPAVAECAGLLFYAMATHGMLFEEVCDVAGLAVAQVLSAISPDIRLNSGLRHNLQRSNVSQADPLGQILMMAYVLTACRHYLDDLTPAELREHARDLKIWADAQDEMVQALPKLASHKSLQATIAKARGLLHDVVRAVEAARIPRRATATLSEAADLPSQSLLPEPAMA